MRKIKRLSDRYGVSIRGQRMRRNPQTWEKALEWWEGVGIDRFYLEIALKSAGIKRRQHEEGLADRIDPFVTREIRDLRKALKGARPLLDFLKNAGWSGDDPSQRIFGDLGENVERSVQLYIDSLRPPPLAAHRPYDPWLRSCVLQLADWLMTGPPKEFRSTRWVKQSKRSTIKAVEQIFKFAGHGDLVTEDKIRHILRKNQRQ